MKPSLQESDIQPNGASVSRRRNNRAFTLIELLACQQKPWRRQARSAFTLIELLVVVAIIAILGAMLLPSVSRAKTMAVNVMCVNQLHQLSLATLMYWNDNGGRMLTLSGIWPSWSDNAAPPSFNNWRNTWPGELLPYVAPGYRSKSGSPPVRVTKMFHDPGLPKAGPLALCNTNMHYYINSRPAYVAAGSPGTGTYTIDIKPIRYPSCFVLFSEDLYYQWVGNELDVSNEVGDRSFDPSWCVRPYHNGYSNFAFADGHVAPFKRYTRGQMTFWYNKMANWSGTP